MRFSLKIIPILLLLVQTAAAQYEYASRGQVSAWLLANDENEQNVGIRYIPTLNLGRILTGEWTIDGELALNSFSSKTFTDGPKDDSHNDFKTYRAWARLSANQFELRIGLQKLNFGSATLLRPLMWFDQLDPRDPLQLTDGVYAALGRYYFLNNTNIWLWFLLGNDGQRGLDIFTSDKEKTEYGGRLQLPFLSGEMAFSVHRREAAVPDEYRIFLPEASSRFTENRFGLDGRWDYFVGLWFESVLLKRDVPLDEFKYERRVTFGGDATAPVGNGITIIAEYFFRAASSEPLKNGDRSSLWASSLRYPIGMLDNFSAMFYFNPDDNSWFRFANWQRTTNNWQFNLIAFWNPEYRPFYAQNQHTVFAGKGVQTMVVFNY
ncbi:MAG: hypothetical protein DWQ05_07300 [Calditrichaeota bacterium]|nr:MAG: hypothetical protein DWQ05_07300 [Calditrichota bacterium]